MPQENQFNQDELFKHLVENAFEFLNKAIDEFEYSPKFSTVHFAVSIELFLKARLLKEHWSLVIENTGNAKRNDFFSGKSKTVNPEAAIKRLKDIVCDPVPEDACDRFRSIAQHRNRMIHFVHGAANNKQYAQAEEEKVITEQLNGWCHLQELLTKNWSEHFSSFLPDLHSVSSKMQSHRSYLTTKFKSVESNIQEHIDNDGLVRNCPSCGFESLLVSHVDGDIHSSECLVCQHKGSFLITECLSDECTQKIEFNSYEGPPSDCPTCKSTFGESISEVLDTNPYMTNHNIHEHTYINCPYCSGYHDVVPHYNSYICTNCFEHSSYMGICDWCHEGQLGGVPEFSEFLGCNFCEGKTGSL